MPVEIHGYDEFKAHVLKLRGDADQQAKTAKDPAARSFARGMVFAYDQIYLALLSWEKNEPD